MRNGDTIERLKALDAAMAHPLRAVVSRVAENPGYPFYQTEQLECGHELRNQSPRWKKAKYFGPGEWAWPSKRRCWKCEETR